MSLKFGTFMAPFHCPVGQDPTAAYERDLDVLRHMDRLGFEEACGWPTGPCSWTGCCAAGSCSGSARGRCPPTPR